MILTKTERRGGGRALTMVALLLVAVVAMLALARPASAATFTVTKDTDTNDGTCNSSDCSLREAIIAANAAAGADTITLPNGAYKLNLTGNNEDAAATGDLDIAGSLTINGAGTGSTIIDGNNTDAVFDTFNAPSNTTISMSNLTIQHGNTTGASFAGAGGIYTKNTVTMSLTGVNVLNNTVNTSGGGIWNEGDLTITNSTISGNQANGQGGGIRNAGTPLAKLSITNSTIRNNVAEFGGGIYDSTDGGINLTITGSTISGNQAVDRPGGIPDDFGDGGGIDADTDGGVSVTKSTFSGNTAARNGGAIYFKDSATAAAGGTLDATFNRITGNTAASGSGLFHAVTPSGRATAEKNWWGCNAGPSASTCDRVSGTVDFTPWIVLGHTASPNTIQTGQSTTLTADFLKNNDASSNSAGDLGALTGVPITFGNAELGTISNPQTTIQSNTGAASATYTAGSTAGTGHADATVDSETATANITISQPPATTVTSTNRSASNPTNASSVTWTVAYADALSGLTASNFELVSSGLGGTPAITAVTPVGSAPATNWTVTASTGSGDGTLGLNMVNDTGLSRSVSNLPSTGQVYTIDATAPTVTIDQASDQADPTSSSPIHFTAVFSEPVTGFTDSDVALSGSTAGPTTAEVTEIAPNDDTTYDVAVSGMTSDGAVDASIPANAAQDAVGNDNSASTSTDKTVTFTVNHQPTDIALGSASVEENQPPGTTVGSFTTIDPDSGDTHTYSLVPDASSGDNASFSIEGATLKTTTSFDYETKNSYSIRVRTTDRGSPAQYFEKDFTITVTDASEGPDTIIDSGPSGYTTSTSATFAFHSDPSGATFECSLDNAAYQSCSSPKRYTKLAQGQHTFQVRAKDAGGTDTTPAQRSFTVDTTAPDTKIDSGPNAPTNNTKPTFTFSGTDNLAASNELQFSYKVDNGTWSAYSSDTSATLGGSAGLSQGSHTFYVRAKDLAGNFDGTPAQQSFTVDTTAPTVKSVSPRNNATGVSATTTLTATFSEAMDRNSLTNTTFTLKQGDNSVGATVAYDAKSNKVTLTPTSPLQSQITYTATIKSGSEGAKDAAGNPLASPDTTWRFTVK